MLSYYSIFPAFLIGFITLTINSNGAYDSFLISEQRSLIAKLNNFSSDVAQVCRLNGSSNQSLTTTAHLLVGKLNSFVSLLQSQNLSRGYGATTLRRKTCREGWIKYEDGCFKFFPCDKPCTVARARKVCQNHSAELAKSTSCKQELFFVDNLPWFTENIFLGGKQDENGAWRWPDGSLINETYANWFEGEPNPNLQCLRMYYTNQKWFSYGCHSLPDSGADRTTRFICEL